MFRRHRNGQAGWTAVSWLPEGIAVARAQHVSNGKPRIDLCRLYNAESAEAALEKAAKDTELTSGKCSSVLNSGAYQVLLVEAPNVQPAELKTAIRWVVKDLIDYHIDDATVDVLDLPPDPNGSTRTHSMYAVTARNSVIQNIVDLFADAKVALNVIDIPEMAQRNLANLVEEPGRGVAVLSFDDSGGLLTVSFNGELYLTRRIDIPLAQLMQAGDEGRTHLFERITLELQRSLDHFDRQYHFIAVSKLFLAPLPERLGLREYLSNNLYITVVAFKLDQVLDIGAVAELSEPANQQRFWLTLGAALREEAVTL